MKTLAVLLLLLFTLFALSCSIPKNNKDIQLNTTTSILEYKDSIDRSLSKFKKEKSLPFSAGAYTFLITKYYKDDKTAVLVEQGDNGEYGSLEKRYYLKDGKMILYTENAIHKLDTLHYTEARAFYQDGLQFAAELRKSSDKEHLQKTKFQKSKPLTVHVKNALDRYEDALNQTGQFDLAFEEIIEYPKAIYIILSHNDLNLYRSSLLIQKQDNFIREIINNPIDYRGRKVKMNWIKKDSEYVYVSGGFK